MNVLLLSHDEVVALLPMEECIPLMHEALVSLAEGLVHEPLRTIVRPPGAAGVMGLMPSYSSGAHPAFGLKAICIFNGNAAQGKDSHQGAVQLFSAESGELLAVINASAVTAVRTAAVSGVATRPGRPRPRGRPGRHRRGRAGALAHRSDVSRPPGGSVNLTPYSRRWRLRAGGGC